jgi:hypothetical protein
VLLATILSCHALAGDIGWWLCDGEAPYRRDDSHGLLPLLWAMQIGPSKYFILHKLFSVVYHTTTGEVKLIGRSVTAKPLTVVTTRIGSSSSG